MAGLCATFSGLGVEAKDVVQNAYGVAQAYASSAFSQAQAFTTALSEFTVEPVNVSVSFDSSLDFEPFTQPLVPTDPNLDFTFNDSFQDSIAGLIPASIQDLTNATPSFTTPDPSPAFPASPSPQAGSGPGTAPAISTVVFPAEPVIAIPSVPSLLQLNIPSAPAINITALSTAFDSVLGEQPAINPAIINDLAVDVGGQFSTQYAALKSKSDAFLAENPVIAKNISKVNSMLDGGTGIPDAIWQAILDRGYGERDKQEFQALQTIEQDWSSRGFTLPGGVVLNRFDATYQAARDDKYKLIRDLVIRRQDVEIENLRFAVQQGIVLEGQYRQHGINLLAQTINVVSLITQVAQAVFSAKVAIFSAQLQAWQTKVEAFKTKVQLELSKLEQFRAEIDAQRLIGEVNQQTIALYVARLDGVKTTVEVYKAQIEAVNLQIEADSRRIEIFKAQVEAFKSAVEADRVQYEAYDTAVKAEVSKINIFESQVRAYAERVRAFVARVDASKIYSQEKLDYNAQKVREYLARLEAFKARLEAEVSRIQSGSLVFEGQSRLYAAKVSAEETRTRSNQQQVNLEIEAARAKADLELKKAELNIQQTLRSGELALSAIEGGTRTAAQLAAGAMSSINIGAQMQHQTGYSSDSDCVTTYNINASA